MAGDTITKRFHDTAAALGDRPALKYREGGEWRDITWTGYAEAVREVAMGLASVGVEPGQAVGILSRNRPEWHVVDVGGMCAGGVIAYEMAVQLISLGETVKLVALLDAATPHARPLQ